jgi:WD40 repeat protein
MTLSSAGVLDAQEMTPPVAQVYGDPHFHADGDLLALAFAADGTLWSAEEPGVLRHWDPTGRQLALHTLSDLETAWAFNADARLLASSNDSLAVWDVAAGQLLRMIPQASWVTALAFRDDSRLIATGHDDGLVSLWELRSGRLIGEFAGPHCPVSALAFSHDGKRLAFAGENCVIYIWNLETGQQFGQLTGHHDRIQALGWHPSGDRLVSAAWDATARVWDAAACEPLLILNYHSSQVTAVAFSPDGRLIASADADHALHVWDMEAKQLRQRLFGHHGTILSLRFRADGACLASGGEDRIIRLWELQQTPAALSPASGPQTLPEIITSTLAPVLPNGACVAINGDGTRLASVQGPRLQVFASATAQVLHVHEAETPLQSLAYSPDGRWIAGGGADGVIRLWDGIALAAHAPLDDPDQREPVTALAFAPDSNTLASASATRMEVWLWNVATGEPVLLIPDAVAGCAIEALAFHPKGRLLATGGIDWLSTGGSDGAISIWDLDERCEIATLDGGSRAVAIHPSGRWLASASLTQSLCIWDLDTRELVEELVGHEDTLNCVAYSPDGQYLASGADDRTLCLWDVLSGRLVATSNLDTQVKFLVFSPDGRYLYTGNGNLTCYQLDVQRLLTLQTV